MPIYRTYQLEPNQVVSETMPVLRLFSVSGTWGGQTTRGYMNGDLSGAETLSGAIVIKFTGENAVATANDIVFQGWKITLHRK